MTKLWKRSLSMFLALVMVIGMLPLNVLADDAETDAAENIAVEQSAETQAPPTEPSATEVPATQAATEPAAETETTAAGETEAATEPAQTQPTEDEAATVADAQATDEAALANAQEEAASVWEYTAVPDVDGLPSDEELFRGYAEGVLYGNNAATFGTFAGDQLEGDLKLTYDALVPVLKQIANGDRASAVISVGDTFQDYTADVAVDLDGTDLGTSEGRQQFVGTLLDTLLSDLPYDLYWFDKVEGLTISVAQLGELTNVTFEFYVSAVYQNGDNLTVNTALTGAASSTASKAQSVVNQVTAENITDYDILRAYKNWICDNVTYDHDAAASNGSGGFQENSDPWQVIYVFDGDTSTNVVCEGYSKAFQYLCDLTDWSGVVECYSVTGTLSYSSGYGPHMWNIVKLEDAFYLVDVTNCDTATGTEDNSLFLVGGAPNADGSYTFAGCTFTYDDDTHALWDGTGVLTLSEGRYGVFTQADLLAGIAAGAENYYYEIPESLTLESDCTIDASYVYTDEKGDEHLAGWCVYVPEGVTLTVPAGVTLTVKGALGLNGGSVVVQEGGKLVIGSSEAWGNIYLWGGSLSIASKAAPTITNGLVIVELGSGYVLDAAVPKDNLHAQAYINSETELRDVLNTTEFSSRDIYVQSSFDITSDLTLEAGDYLCLNNESVLTVKKDVTLAIEEYATLVVSQGSILVNNGTITVDTDGSLTGNGEFQNNGKLNGNHTVVAAERETMTQQEFVDAVAAAGDGFYSLRADVTIESDCTLPEGYTVWVQPSGSLTVAAGATLTVDGQLSTTNGTITVDGTLINNGHFSLDSNGNRGSIVINGKLENNKWLGIYSGTLTFNGTYIGGGRVEWDCVSAKFVGAEKIGKDNIYAVIIARTENALFAAMDSTLAEGYADYTVKTDEDITLTKDLTIPQGIRLTVGYSYTSDGGQYQYGLTVPQGITLANQGSIYVIDHSYLRVNEGATLNNQGRIEVAGQLVNNGSLEGMGTITGDGEISGNTQALSLADRLAAAAESGETVELAEAVTLESSLDVNAELHILEDGSITVPWGYTLTITDPVVLKGGLIRVENGGTLQVNGTLTIESGTVYIANGAKVNTGEGVTLPDGILYGEDMTPSLGCRWLKNDGDGWYEDSSEDIAHLGSIGSMVSFEAIFYLNAWDEDALEWTQTPVVPQSNQYLAFEPLTELGETIAADQENGEYFVKFSSRSTLEETEVTINANGYFVPFTIYQMELGFFTSQYPSASSCIVDPVQLKAGEDNEVYLVVIPDNVTAIITSQDISPNFDPTYGWTPLKDIEVVEAGRIWKYIVGAEFVDYLQCNPESFSISIDALFTPEEGEEYTCYREVQFDPPETALDPKAILKIGDDAYRIFENGIILRENEDGLKKTQLPDGVSYDLVSNTLTLDGAEVGALHLDGGCLPTDDLTIKLAGESTLSSVGDYALSINGGISVGIEGEGTLTLDAGLSKGIYVSKDSTVIFEGGTIDASYSCSELFGRVVWNGTTFNGIGAKISISGDQRAEMRGGEINLTGTEYQNTNGEVVECYDVLEITAPISVYGGSITIRNGILHNISGFTLAGGLVDIENSYEYGYLGAVENYGDLILEAGRMDVRASGAYAVWNKGDLTIQGGELFADAGNGTALAVVAGPVLIDTGFVALSGHNGLVVNPYQSNVDEDCSPMVQIAAGYLRITATENGITTFNAPVTIEGQTTDDGRYIIPEITIEAGGAAVYSLSDSLDNTNFYTENGKELAFRTEDGQYLTLTSTETDDGYLHSVENDGTVSVVIRGFTTLDAFIEGMEAAAAKNETYVLEESLVLDSDLTLISDVILKDGVTLTVAENKTLTIPQDRLLATNRGGELIVEGTLANAGTLANDGGTMMVTGTYESLDDSAEVTCFAKNGVLPTITGIPAEQIVLAYHCASEEELNGAVAYAETYRRVEVTLTDDITINQSITIPWKVSIHTAGCDITIAEGAEVEMRGYLNVLDSTVTVNGTLDCCASVGVGHDDEELASGQISMVHVGTTGTLNNSCFLYVHEDGVLQVDGTMTSDSEQFTYLMIYGELIVNGSASVEHIFEVTGKLTIGENGTLTNGYDGHGLNIYGTLDVYGTLDNNGSIWLRDSAVVTVHEGAAIENYDVFRDSVRTGTMAVNGTLRNYDKGMVLVDYYDDGTTAKLSLSDESQRAGFTLYYEGDTESAVRAVAGQAASRGYRDYLIYMNGSLTVSGETLEIASNGTMEVMGDLKIEGTLVNYGNLRTNNYCGRITIQENGYLVNDGTMVIEEDCTLVVGGRLVNEWNNGYLYVNGEYQIYDTGIIENRFDSDSLASGGIYGIPAYEVFVYTEVSDEAQLRNAFDNLDKYAGSCVGINVVADLEISKDLTIPQNTTLCAGGDEAVCLTIGENAVITNCGRLTAGWNATIQVNGKLRAADSGCVRITDGANLVIGSDDVAAQVIVDPDAALVIADGFYTLHSDSEIVVVWDGNNCSDVAGVTADATLEMVFDEASGRGLDGFNAMCGEMVLREYAAARVIFRDNYGTSESLYVPENVEMIVTNNANVTVNDLENYGSVSIDAGSTLHVTGELIGNEPTGEGEFIGSDVMTQTEFEEELANADEAYELQCRVELTRDLTIPKGKYVDITSGELIVESGAMLTVEGLVNVSNSGKLSVLPGGCLNNQGCIEVHALPNDGYVKVEGDYICGDEAMFGVDWFLGSPLALSGNVPKSAQFLISTFPYYKEQLYAMIGTCEEGGYAGAEVYVSDMTLAQDLTIPQNVTVNVTPIEDGMYSTEGWLDITGNVTVNGRLQVLAGARLRSSGTITLNKGSFLGIEGTYEGNAPTNNGGTIIPGAADVTVSAQDDITAWDIHEAESCVLTVSVSSALENYETLQYVTWTSSNKNIVDPANIVDHQDGTYTVVFGNAVGDVKLTATSIDGSKKTASITLTTYYLDTAKKLTATVDVPAIGLQPGQEAAMQVFGTDLLDSSLLSFTSSNDEIATVKDGVITGGTKTGTAKITAAIKDDPLKRSVTVSVKVIPAQIEYLNLDWIIDDQEAKQLDLEVDESAARTYILKPRPVYPMGVNGSDLTKSSIKWTSSDTKLATVTANTDGSATVTIKAGADGVCNITAVSNDLIKASAVAPITVKDYSPRLGASSVTLNPKLEAGTEVALVESYGNAIQSVAISDDRLDVNYDSGILTVSKKEGVDAISNCTINAVLTVETKLDDVARNYEYNLKVTVKNTVPSVTVKQTGKVDLFYTNSTASLSVTVKDAVVEDVELDAQDFELIAFDPETATGTIGFSDSYIDDHTAKPVTKVTLLVTLEGYAVPVEKTVTIGTTTSKISLSTNPTSSTVNTNCETVSAYFYIYNKTMKEVEVLDNVEVIGVPFTHENGRVDVTLDAAVKQTLTVEVSNDNWMQSVTLKHTVNVTTAEPTVKLGTSTLKLSTVFPGQSVATSVSLNQSNLEIDGFTEFTTTSAEAQKLDVSYSNGEIVASFVDAEDLPKTGTYTFTGTPTINGTPMAKPVTIKVTVNTAVPTVKLSATTLKLNNRLAGKETATANVTMTNSTGYDLKLVRLETEDEQVFDVETGKLSMTLDENTATGKYIYELYPVVKCGDTEVKLPKALKLTVNVHNSRITVSQSTSGKLDAIDPASAIVYTVSKINNAIGKIEDVTLGGEDADKFQAELGANTAGKQTITLKMKPGEVYNTKTTYKVNLLYTICGEEVPSSTLSVKVNQSTPKFTAAAVQYYQSQQDIPARTTLTLTTPASAEIESISVNQTKTSKDLLEALGDTGTAMDIYTEDFRTFEIGIQVKNPGCLVAGKSYSLYLDVTPAGCAENVAPTAVKITVKVAK